MAEMAKAPPTNLGIAENIPLAGLTTLGLGGPARYYIATENPARLLACVQWAQDADVPIWILGGGSNVVIADEGLAGLVITPADNSVDVRSDGPTDVLVTVGAGATWDDVVALAVDNDLAGIECLSGIPGLCGAAPMQNIGAYGQQLSDVFVAADVLDLKSGSVSEWDLERCAFGYRDSALKRSQTGSLIVLRITMRLRRGGAPRLGYAELKQRLGTGATLRNVRATVLAVRSGKGMVVDRRDPDSRSAGSFFVNPIVAPEQAQRVSEVFPEPMPSWSVPGGVKLSAAWLIERCGMHKGYGDGPIGLSTKHTLAIVHRGGGTAAQLLAFAAHIQRRVHEKTGIQLVREPRILGQIASPTATR